MFCLNDTAAIGLTYRIYDYNLREAKGNLRELQTELDNFVVYVCVGGRATLVPDGGVACTLAQGKTVLVPACVRMVEIRPEGGVKLLECGV